MAVRLKELLNLDILKEFRITAGQVGMDRLITKVGILDYELGDVIDKNFIRGEFVLTNLLIIKDDLSQLEDIVKRLIRAETGGMAIKTLYLDTLPDNIIRLADEHDFPIFLYETTYYEDIITELVDYIKKSDELSNQLTYISKLSSYELDVSEVQKLAYKLNPDFMNWITAIKLSWQDIIAKPGFSPYNAGQVLGQMHRCYADEGHIYLLFSFEHENPGTKVIEDLCHSIGIDSDSIYGGFSGVKRIEELNHAVVEANYAYTYSKRLSQKGLNGFDDMGLYKLVLPLEQNPWMESYYNKIITPIVEYDLKNGADLMKTARIYIETGCDVKKTAELMYQHGNTIRYRLDRIRGLLDGIVEKAYVDQELAVAIRLHSIKAEQ